MAVGYRHKIAVVATDDRRERCQCSRLFGMRRAPLQKFLARHVGRIKSRSKRLLNRPVKRFVTVKPVPWTRHDPERFDETAVPRILDLLLVLGIQRRHLPQIYRVEQM